MALISLRQLLDHAAERGNGLPAFNVNSMEQIQAITQVAEACDSRRTLDPNTHLVMRGSSCAPQDWPKVIHEHGGNIRETCGVPVAEIREGIRFGVRKVNIDTDIRLAMTGAVRLAMARGQPDEFERRAFLKAATAAAKGVCRERFEAFGGAGRASRLKLRTLDAMAAVYAHAAPRLAA